jgi:hypothetical protein
LVLPHIASTVPMWVSSYLYPLRCTESISHLVVMDYWLKVGSTNAKRSWLS